MMNATTQSSARHQRMEPLVKSCYICKVQALCLCHPSRRDDIMQLLKDKGYAFMQFEVDNQLLNLLCDEMMLFIDRTTSPWKALDHTRGPETLPLSMVDTKNLGQSSNFYAPHFGNINKKVQSSFYNCHAVV